MFLSGKNPDFTLVEKCSSVSSMTAVTVIEIKRPCKSVNIMVSFSDSAIGQLIDYGCHLLLVDSNRPFVIVALTDTYRIQFFKIDRAALACLGPIVQTEVLSLRDVPEVNLS